MRIGFVGAGQMASALLKGILDSGQAKAADCAVFDPAAGAITRIQSLAPGITVAGSNAHLIEQCETVFLAVKPQSLSAIVDSLPPSVGNTTLIVSIMAGVGIQQLEAAFGHDRIIRAMPNTPALVGCGATAYAATPAVTAAEKQAIQSLLQSVGFVVELPESMLDAVTGLSGSGPAFVFQFLEALADGGVHAGLPRQVAMDLALHTVLGAAELARSTGDHPAALKDRVASPAGTTIDGIQALEAAGFRGAVMNAVSAAARRSRQLGQG